MEDFNRMCADLEAGLTRDKTAADAGIAQAKAAAAAAAGTANAAVVPADLRSGLFRVAYNHYWLTAEQEDPVHQQGVVRQVFGKNKGSWSELELLEDRARLYNNGGESLTVASVRDSMVVNTSFTSSADLASVTFTAHCAGRLTSITYYGHVRDNPGDPGNCTVRIRDLTTGAVTEGRNCFNFSKGSSTLYRPLPLDLSLRAGHKYKIEVTLDSTAANHELMFHKINDGCLGLSSVGSPSFSQSWQLQTGEAGLGGLALVRYLPYGQGGSLRLNWDGVSYTPFRVRTVPNEQGEEVQIAEFRRSTAVPANSSLTITAACPVGGELELFEMGAVVI